MVASLRSFIQNNNSFSPSYSHILKTYPKKQLYGNCRIQYWYRYAYKVKIRKNKASHFQETNLLGCFNKDIVKKLISFLISHFYCLYPRNYTHVYMCIRKKLC